jgi:hypothetical protein
MLTAKKQIEECMANRRSFLQHALGLGAGLLATPGLVAATPLTTRSDLRHEPDATRAFNSPVISPDVGDLPYTVENGVKVFRLTAQVIRQQVAPNKVMDVWGYNGSAPGPTIQVNQGDRMRVIFKNELPEPSSVHWHGFEDAIGYDGMPGISQEPVKPGESFTYEFHIHQEGTYFYHSHMAMQEMAGMLGAIIMHPSEPYRPHCDKDFALCFQEYSVLPNSTVPNTMSMEFNWLVINGKAGPAITPLIVRQGDRVRIRMINLGMDHHPIHVHGHTFQVTGTEGGRIPQSAWWPGNTVLLGVAQARNVELVANNPGDWMLHCHLPHHMMNQMATQAGPMTRSANDGQQARAQESTKVLEASAGMDDNGPLADTQLNPDMMGMMMETQQNSPRMSSLQKRNMAALDMSMHAMQQQDTDIAPNANDVPNFPQDAYMEGPMMNMDTLVEKPENYGLRPDWTRYMQGMMTFLRVLPPNKYDEVVARMLQAQRPSDPYASLYNSTNGRVR